MILDGYLIERYSNMGGAYTCRRLVEEAGRRDIRLDIVGVSDVSIGPNGQPFLRGGALPPRRMAINRYKWGHAVSAINGVCDVSFNRYDLFTRYVDKFNQLLDVRSEAFEVPRWMVGTAALDFDLIASAMGVPFVAKGLRSSQGREVWLVRDAKDLGLLLRKLGPDKELLFERFVASSSGSDIRVFGIHGEPIACMRRTSTMDFRANYALGARIASHAIDADIRRAVRDVYRSTGLEFFGLDLLQGDGRYWFCEVNVMAGIEGIESVTDVNVAGAIMDAIAGEVRP